MRTIMQVGNNNMFVGMRENILFFDKVIQQAFSMFAVVHLFCKSAFSHPTYKGCIYMIHQNIYMLHGEGCVVRCRRLHRKGRKWRWRCVAAASHTQLAVASSSCLLSINACGNKENSGFKEQRALSFISFLCFCFTAAFYPWNFLLCQKVFSSFFVLRELSHPAYLVVTDSYLMHPLARRIYDL